MRMVKVTVLYPSGSGLHFDMDYYVNRHTPFVEQTLGAALKGVTIDEGVAGGFPGTPAPYFVICGLLFESVEAFQQMFAAHGATLLADIPNYTNTQPRLQISNVVRSR